MASTRRLAAILAADVVGYSRLMGVDEEGTHERLKVHLGQLVEPKIAEHRGRIVKNTGDGLLAEFPSVVEAVRSAVEIQRGMAEREPDVPEDRRITFRIGVNLGDVIVEPEDIFGDGVNITARLEGLAEPGGICISRVVRDQIRDKLPYQFEDMGRAAGQEHRAASAGLPGPRSCTAHRGTVCLLDPATAIARQALDCGPALRQYERRPGAGVFRRRHGRGDHHCALTHPLALRDRP
jgi:class 3 adenylate cyclase